MMKRGKRELAKVIELPKPGSIMKLGEKENVGLLEANTITQKEMNENLMYDYLWRISKLIEMNIYSRNFIKGINTWTFLFARYTEPFLK